MKFNLSSTWSYDPLAIISKLRVEHKTTPYTHTQRPKIKRYFNQLTWTENTLPKAKEQLVSTSALQAPTPQDKVGKRQREE